MRKFLTCIFVAAAFAASAEVVKMTPLTTFISGTNAILEASKSYTDASVDYTPANTQLVSTIYAVSPTYPGYSAVSNAAMNALSRDEAKEDLDGKASTNDVVLTPVYSQTPAFSEWVIDATGTPYAGTDLRISWTGSDWCLYSDNSFIDPPAQEGDENSTSLNFVVQGVTATRTRMDVVGYTLGTQTDKTLAATNILSATYPPFSNAVLSVGLGIDTNTVAAINALVESGDELPIGGATTVGGLLLALAAAVAALKRKKADKVASATSGNFAGLDGNGNLTDSGKKAADFATADAVRYGIAVVTDGQLLDRDVQKVTLNAATTTLVLPGLTSGKVSDFGIDMVNAYEVSGTPTAASFTLSGTLETDYNIITADGDDWGEMTALAAGEMAEYYFTLSAFAINDKPTWRVLKQTVTQATLPVVTP